MSSTETIETTLTSSSDSESVYAAIDLGSNSFHMIVARETDGVSQIIDKHKEMVRLRSCIDESGNLNDKAFEKGMACLQRFRERLHGIPSANVRAVGTNTLRVANNSRQFLEQARQSLGHRIQIIAGQEEARLIYLGVAHGLPKSTEQRLVMDIGGGSTEFIIGREVKHSHLTSTEMGCVSITEKFFKNGELSPAAFEKAINYCRRILLPHRQNLMRLSWDNAYGASGTIKSVGQILAANGWTQGELTLEGLLHIREAMIEAKTIDALTLEGLKEERRPVITGGLAILIATFQELHIHAMTVSNNALREGLIIDTLGRMYSDDARDISVQRMQNWMKVDIEQANVVSDTAKYLFNQAHNVWGLHTHDIELNRLLNWAAKLHECGMAISYKRYRNHSAYILSQADMSGFNQQEQQILSALALNHRGKIDLSVFEEFDESLTQQLLHLVVLLRLSVRIHRSRDYLPIHPLFSIDGENIQLQFDENWLDEHPLTKQDLKQEAKQLSSIGLKLKAH